MEKSKVYFTKIITPEKMIEMEEMLGRELKGKVAVKLHSLSLIHVFDQQRRELHWLRRLAHQDCLTGLYNRFKIQQLIEETLRCAPEGKRMTLAVMDIDNFKQINDAYGHDCGDEALRQTAAEIRELFAPCLLYTSRHSAELSGQQRIQGVCRHGL